MSYMLCVNQQQNRKEQVSTIQVRGIGESACNKKIRMDGVVTAARCKLVTNSLGSLIPWVTYQTLVTRKMSSAEEVKHQNVTATGHKKSKSLMFSVADNMFRSSHANKNPSCVYFQFPISLLAPISLPPSFRLVILPPQYIHSFFLCIKQVQTTLKCTGDCRCQTQ